MKVKLRYAGAILAVCGLLAVVPAATSHTAQASVQCVQYPNHDAYLCVGSNSAGGALYWTDYLYTREVYWHPASGYLTATEAFYCDDNTVAANGHTACLKDAPGVDVAGITSEAEYTHRVISLADGCVIQGWNVYDTNTSPPAPTQCAGRAMTSLEQASALRFWQAMQLIPGAW